MWPFNSEPLKPLRRIVLNHSQWADSLTPGNLKRDIAINMGLFDAGLGMGYHLEVNQTNDSNYVYDPHEYSIRAESVCGSSYKDGVHTGIDVLYYEFTIKAARYSLRCLFDATVKAIEGKHYTEGRYESTYEDFEKKWGV